MFADLTQEKIARYLRARQEGAHEVQPHLSPAQLALRPAAVLLPLLQIDGAWNLLFTHRTDSVQHHKGQVSFPGGAADPEDGSPEATALREAYEEVGLRSADVTVLGQMNRLITVTNYRITPVVGCVRWPVNFQLSAIEVSRAFTIPLDWLADPNHREMRPFQRAGYTEEIIYYQPYDGETLWGASAYITVEFLRLLQVDKKLG